MEAVRRQWCFLNYRTSHEKKHSADQIIDENDNFTLKHRLTVKKTDSLLINLSRSPRKKTRKATPHPLGNCPFLNPHPLPSEFLLPSAGGGGGVDIFWNYTILLVKRGTRLLKFQPMHCTVPCISSQHLACYGLLCLNCCFFLILDGTSVERFTVIAGGRGSDYRDCTNT